MTDRAREVINDAYNSFIFGDAPGLSFAEHLDAALAQEGLAVVPVEASGSMLSAGVLNCGLTPGYSSDNLVTRLTASEVAAIYRAMISAAKGEPDE